MARRRRPAPRMIGGVPAQLAHPEIEFWSDPDAVAELARLCGMRPKDVAPARVTEWDWLAVTDRFNAFRNAWARHHGMVRDYGSSKFVDWNALRQAGVCASSRPPGWARPNNTRPTTPNKEKF